MAQLEYVNPSLPVIPSTHGRIGHGEGVLYDNKHFYARGENQISKRTVTYLRWEGFYCGRQRGDTEYLIIAWDETTQAFAILEHVHQLLRERLKYWKRYRTPARAITAWMQHQLEREQFAARFRCSRCGRSRIIYEERARTDLCDDCCKKDPDESTPGHSPPPHHS